MFGSIADLLPLRADEEGRRHMEAVGRGMIQDCEESRRQRWFLLKYEAALKEAYAAGFRDGQAARERET